MRPTPEMSFAIRHLGCQSGIILTASHNPKEYNGYKAYWDDGAQVLAPHDAGIIDEVNNIASAADIKFKGNPDLIQIIGEDIDKIYLDMVKTVSIDPEAIARHKDMKIVYTPIHGTGMMLIPRALKKMCIRDSRSVMPKIFLWSPSISSTTVNAFFPLTDSFSIIRIRRVLPSKSQRM